MWRWDRPGGLSEHARSSEYPGSIGPIRIGNRLDTQKTGIVPDTSLDPQSDYRFKRERPACLSGLSH